MATLTVQVMKLTGLEETFVAAAAGGDVFANDGMTFLHVKNGGGSDITVTIDSLVNSNFGTDVNPAVVVTAGEERMLGLFPKDRFNNASGQVVVAYSGVTTVTVAAVRVVQSGL